MTSLGELVDAESDDGAASRPRLIGRRQHSSAAYGVTAYQLGEARDTSSISEDGGVQGLSVVLVGTAV